MVLQKCELQIVLDRRTNSNVPYLRQENFADPDDPLQLNDSLLLDDSLVLTESSTHDTSEPVPVYPDVAVDSSFVDNSSPNTVNQSFVSSRETPFLVDNSYTSFDRDISALLDDSVFRG